jgi:hypothetical protein
MNEIDTDYSKYWIRATSSVDEALEAIRKASQVGDGACDFRTSVANVSKSAKGAHKLFGLMIIGIGIGKLGLTGKEVAFPSPETVNQFNNMMNRYHIGLDEWAQHGSLSGEAFRDVIDSLISYLTAIGAPDELIGAIGYSGYSAAAGLR